MHIHDPLVDRSIVEKEYGIKVVDKSEIQSYRY